MGHTLYTYLYISALGKTISSDLYSYHLGEIAPISTSAMNHTSWD